MSYSIHEKEKAGGTAGPWYSGLVFNTNAKLRAHFPKT